MLSAGDKREATSGVILFDHEEVGSRSAQGAASPFLRTLLERCGGNVSKASREAGIDRVYLRKLLRKHGLVSGPD